MNDWYFLVLFEILGYLEGAIVTMEGK